MKIIEKFGDKINGVLEAYDRMIIRGHLLPFYGKSGKMYFLSEENVKLVDFSDYAQQVTDMLKANVMKIAADSGRPLIYLNSPTISKETVALKALEKDHVKEGLICVLSTLEMCQSLEIRKNSEEQILELKNGRRKCLHYYLYYMDREFGFMHVRLQTWFPFEIQVYINGREFIARQLDKCGVRYERYDNCFTWIEDIEKAQKIANSLEARDFTRMFDRFAHELNPYLKRIEEVLGHGYHWCLDQCEYATDIMFKSRKDLSAIYKDLVEHALLNFNCEDVMIFLGRKMHPAFTGEIVSDIKTRPEGVRIKHKMKSNSIKMYDKYSVLRIETTINDPHEFKIYKEVGEKKILRWVSMGKSITNLYRYSQVCSSSNKRYLDALSMAEFKQDSIAGIEKLCCHVKSKNRIYTGFNLLSPETERIFHAVMDGKNHINGFTNSSVRKIIFPNAAPEDIKIRNKTTRIISKLRAHKLISKVPKSFKYRISTKGVKIISAILEIKKRNIPKAI